MTLTCTCGSFAIHLYIVNIFGRELTVLGADSFTKEFFNEHGQNLGEEMSLAEEVLPK